MCVPIWCGWRESCLLWSRNILSTLSNELTNQQFLGEGPEEGEALLDLGLQVVYAPMVMIHQWYEIMGKLRETLLWPGRRARELLLPGSRLTMCTSCSTILWEEKEVGPVLIIMVKNWQMGSHEHWMWSFRELHSGKVSWGKRPENAWVTPY